VEPAEPVVVDHLILQEVAVVIQFTVVVVVAHPVLKILLPQGVAPAQLALAQVEHQHRVE
jgi:hypothetical protein